MTEHKQHIGKYEILGLLGKGGMGNVYLGQASSTNLQVAIKVLASDEIIQDEELLDRLKREGEALRILDHPNIVKMLDVIENEGRYSLVLEYVDGGSLWDLLRRLEQLPISAVLKIALELADALTRAHHLKIIHRDIKPANILFAKDGSLRLTDFGLARMEHGRELTQSGMMVGSAAYLSPEAINGAKPHPKMDIWAFGIVLYEMLVGKRPIEAETMAGLLTGVLMQPIPNPSILRPDTPHQLATLIMKMLEKDPEQRISSIRQVAAELEQIIEEIDYQSKLQLPTEITTIIAEERAVEHSSLPVISVPFRRLFGAQTRISSKPSNWFRWQGLIATIGLVIIALGIGLFVGNPFASDDTTTSTMDENEIILVAPVDDGDLMVLVANMEAVGAEQPQIDRFIRENLTETIELNAPLLGLTIREYPRVIRSAEEAQQIALANQTPLIIWGNYDETYIDVNINVFSYDKAALPVEFLYSAGNVRARLTDARTESITPQVLTSAVVWYAYHDLPYQAAAAMVTYYDLDLPSAQTIGSNVGMNVNRHYEFLYSDTATAVEYLDAALQIDPSNPILFHLRGAAIDRLGQTSEALQNVDTAQLLSEGKWSTPYLNEANIVASQGDEAEGINQLTIAISIQDEEWLYYAIRGSYHYLQDDLDLATADFDEAIARDPQANFPYVLAINIGILQGQIEEVQVLLATVLEKFPDPTFGNRIIVTAGNQPEYGGYYGLTLSAFNNLALGQYDAALRDVNGALELRPDSAELYLFQGVVYCVKEDLELAETAFTTGIEFNPDLTVMYLLRADIRNRLGKTIEGLNDFGLAGQTPAWENFEPIVTEALASGQSFGCESFFANPS